MYIGKEWLQVGGIVFILLSLVVKGILLWVLISPQFSQAEKNVAVVAVCGNLSVDIYRWFDKKSEEN